MSSLNRLAEAMSQRQSHHGEEQKDIEILASVWFADNGVGEGSKKCVHGCAEAPDSPMIGEKICSRLALYFCIKSLTGPSTISLPWCRMATRSQNSFDLTQFYFEEKKTVFPFVFQPLDDLARTFMRPMGSSPLVCQARRGSARSGLA